jgi:hypothetical protein
MGRGLGYFRRTLTSVFDSALRTSPAAAIAAAIFYYHRRRRIFTNQHSDSEESDEFSESI